MGSHGRCIEQRSPRVKQCARRPPDGAVREAQGQHQQRLGDERPAGQGQGFRFAGGGPGWSRGCGWTGRAETYNGWRSDRNQWAAGWRQGGERTDIESKMTWTSPTSKMTWMTVVPGRRWVLERGRWGSSVPAGTRARRAHLGGQVREA